MKWEDKVETLENLAASGIEVKALQDRPELNEFEQEVLEHHHNLSCNVAQPFAYTELEAYCRLYGIESFDDRTEFVMYMSSIHQAMVKARKEKKDLNTSGDEDGGSKDKPKGLGQS